jgi:aspartate carbamoyltransferase catalytic subunit
MNRGVEIAAEVADLPRSVIVDQVRNGVAVRMAVLYLLLGADPERLRTAGDEDESAIGAVEPVAAEEIPRPMEAKHG